MLPSQFPEVRTKVLNFVRSNRGFSLDQISKSLCIPVNLIREAVVELKKEGYLAPTSEIKIGNRRLG